MKKIFGKIKKFFGKKDKVKSCWATEDLQEIWASGSDWRKENVNYRRDIIVQQKAITLTYWINMVLAFLCIILVIIINAITIKVIKNPKEIVYFYDGTMNMCVLNDDGTIAHVHDGVYAPVFSDNKARISMPKDVKSSFNFSTTIQQNNE